MALSPVYCAADPLYCLLFLSPDYLATLLWEEDMIVQTGIISFSYSVAS